MLLSLICSGTGTTVNVYLREVRFEVYLQNKSARPTEDFEMIMEHYDIST